MVFPWPEKRKVVSNSLVTKVKSLTPINDQNVNSPPNFNTLSGRQVLRMKIIIRLKI